MTEMKNGNSLIGKYFLTFEKDRKLKWQGQVIAEPNPGYYLCDLFEWISGTRNKTMLIRVDGMRGFDFFNNRDDFVEAIKQYE
jgi:hypothetical protein